MLFSFAVVGGVLDLAVVGSAPARGSPDACSVAIEPADAAPAWLDAVRGLRGWLSGARGGAIDCGSIEVHAEGPHASLLFTTSDGRFAERPVPAPDQLLAVVEALTFTLSEPSVAPDAKPTQPRDAPAVDHAQAVPSEPARSEGQSTRVFIDGWSGVRVPQPTPCSSTTATTCAFASLSLGLGIGLNVGRWELGVAGEYEPLHATLSGSLPTGFTMSEYAVGLWAGRHVPLGKLEATAGLTAAIAVTEESNDNTNGENHGPQGSSAPAEPRAGVFAGLVVPRHASLRVRPQLAFDVVPSHIGKSSPNPGLPELPWWSASATVGVEWEAP